MILIRNMTLNLNVILCYRKCHQKSVYIWSWRRNKVWPKNVVKALMTTFSLRLLNIQFFTTEQQIFSLGYITSTICINISRRLFSLLKINKNIPMNETVWILKFKCATAFCNGYFNGTHNSFKFRQKHA